MARNPLFPALVLICIVWMILLFPVGDWITGLLMWIESLGIWSLLVFILLYLLATVAFVPGTILTLSGGVLFGVVWGTVAVSFGSILGASLAFILGRHFARDWVEEKMNRNKKFQAIDTAVGEEGWKIVFLTRLSPIFPFNLLNYAYGLTKIPFRSYFFSSWVGMLPGSLMYVYIGSLTSSLLEASSSAGTGRTTGEWILLVVGFVATVAVVLYTTRIARNALKKHTTSGA